MEKSFRDVVRSRLRYPGGLHEWLPVERADLIHAWDVPYEEYAALRTPLSEVAFTAPAARHGGPGSARAHHELVALMGSAGDLGAYRERLARWADHRLPAGRAGLPPALQAPGVGAASRERSVPRAQGVGTVSVWLASGAGPETLAGFLAETHDEEDDGRPLSALAAAFGLPWYDHDFLEVRQLDAAAPVAGLLAGFSYADSFGAAAAAAAAARGLAAADTAVLLYDGPYAPAAEDPARAPLRLLGDFPYERREP